MVQHWVFLLFSLAWSFSGFTQDERYYRQILAGELVKLGEEHQESLIPQFNVTGSSYKFDLNGDGIEESIEPEKRDGVDWLTIRNSSQVKIFEAKLLAMGKDSTIYKIRVSQISSKVKALLVFLDEGITQGKHFESTGRFYVISFENNDFKTMKLTEGPHIFHEREARRDQYSRRDYKVNVLDLDGDGIREIMISHKQIQRILRYQGKGKWQRI